MNRLVIIGNGFDLAHNLKTSYENFINWYWNQRVRELHTTHTRVSKDEFFSIELLKDGDWFSYLFSSLSPVGIENNGKIFIDKIKNCRIGKITYHSTFFERIIDSVENKGWVDIENEYYELLKQYAFKEPNILSSTKLPIRLLNQQLEYIKTLLCKYLQVVCEQETQQIPNIADVIYAPIKSDDISVAGQESFKEHVNYWKTMGHAQLKKRKELFGITNNIDISAMINKPLTKTFNGDYPLLLRLPSLIMLLNFNYTDTPLKYLKQELTSYNKIHGDLYKPESVIFGYGDELDDDFKKLQTHENNECLKNIKSIRYLEAPNYRKMLSFIESEPFQVFIMGHSCGNSDRTLLNTIFEHPNCVSIKPYYYLRKDGTDNYIELIQNISRNITNMKLMRDRVVNKTQCEPLVNYANTN